MDEYFSFRHVATAFGALLVTILTGWVTWINNQVTKMYTKDETKQLIELKSEAMRQSIDTNSRVTERLTETLDRLDEVLNRLTIDVEVMKAKQR